jgi:16S rRNA (guanine527-N7)-methyltransferase
MNLEFKNQLKELEINVTDHMLEQFESYYHILVEWNQVMNLTTITEYEEVYVKHFMDSLSIAKVMDMSKITSMIDIGTGAGFPGIPIKIVFPEIKVTLLDSLNKRVKFLNTVIDELGLENITAIHGRAEDFARQGEYREQYDLSVSRAVANLATLSEYCLPYTKIGGNFVSYKSGSINEELAQSEKAIKILGGKVENNILFELPGTDIKRSFVVISKDKQTGKKYPRKAGLPAKEPLH